jgi:CheY-like chemotaxis protein
MRILIVEHEPTHLKLADLVLSSAGHQVTRTESADEALKSVSECQPEIILLDLALPGRDGLWLVRELRASPQTRHIPIVAVTADPEEYPREEALKAGCEVYIVKPIETRNLAAQVEAAARGAKGGE